MRALDERIIYGIGGNGRAVVYECGTVEVVSDRGVSSAKFDSLAEAFHAWLHPFDREGRLAIPGAVDPREAVRPLSEQEYVLAELVGEDEAVAAFIAARDAK